MSRAMEKWGSESLSGLHKVTRRRMVSESQIQLLNPRLTPKLVPFSIMLLRELELHNQQVLAFNSIVTVGPGACLEAVSYVSWNLEFKSPLDVMSPFYPDNKWGQSIIIWNQTHY